MTKKTYLLFGFLPIWTVKSTPAKPTAADSFEDELAKLWGYMDEELYEKLSKRFVEELGKSVKRQGGQG